MFVKPHLESLEERISPDINNVTPQQFLVVIAGAEAIAQSSSQFFNVAQNSAGFFGNILQLAAVLQPSSIPTLAPLYVNILTNLQQLAAADQVLFNAVSSFDLTL